MADQYNRCPAVDGSRIDIWIGGIHNDLIKITRDQFEYSDPIINGPIYCESSARGEDFAAIAYGRNGDLVRLYGISEIDAGPGKKAEIPVVCEVFFHTVIQRITAWRGGVDVMGGHHSDIHQRFCWDGSTWRASQQVLDVRPPATCERATLPNIADGRVHT